MEIHASSTCKHLKDRRKKKQPDLRKRCCDLRLIATCADDSKLLTVLYRIYTYGGKMALESEDLKVQAEIDRFASAGIEPKDSGVTS